METVYFGFIFFAQYSFLHHFQSQRP